MSARMQACIRDLWDGNPAVINEAYINCETAGFVRGGELTVKGIEAAWTWFGIRIVDGDTPRLSTTGRRVGATTPPPSADFIDVTRVRVCPEGDCGDAEAQSNVIRFPIVPRLSLVLS